MAFRRVWSAIGLALVGDKIVQRFPECRGSGKVTATKLLNQHGSIAGIFENAESIKGKMGERFRDPENHKKVLLSRQLVGLKMDVDVRAEIETLKPGDWDEDHMRRDVQGARVRNFARASQWPRRQG